MAPVEKSLAQRSLRWRRVTPQGESLPENLPQARERFGVIYTCDRG